MAYARLPWLANALVLWAAASVALQPASAEPPATAGGVRAPRIIEYARVDNRPLLMDIKIPASAAAPAPVVLRISNRRDTGVIPADPLLAGKYAVATAAWMPQDSEGIFGGFPRDLFAVKAAVRHLRANAADLGIDPDRIAVAGTGNGATLAALLAVTSDVPGTEGRLGSHLDTASRVGALVMINGVTDWRNAELYGDERVNDIKASPYHLFSANVKEVPSLARQASAINYVRPRVPPVLLISTNTLERRAMYQTWTESLKRINVPVTFLEPDAPGATIDDDTQAARITAFLDERLKAPAPDEKPLSPEEEVDVLAKAGLFKQARRIIDDNLSMASVSASENGRGGGSSRDKWRKLIQQVSDGQAEAMAAKLVEARKTRNYDEAARLMWTIREIVTDPSRLGQFQIEAVSLAQDFDGRANVYRQAELLNAHVQRRDFAAADRILKSISDLASLTGDKDEQIVVRSFASRYRELRNAPNRTWPDNVRPVGWASAFGQDLYGYWMDMRVGGVLHRLRYVPAGKFRMGSSREEWGRQADEPELREVAIARGFWMGESEVTQEFYDAVMGANTHQSFFTGKRLPVDNVSYQHAVNFMEKLGVEARLPTQEEWEYACRAGSVGAATGTGRLSDMAWHWNEAEDVGNRGDAPVLPELRRMLGPKARVSHVVKTKLPNAWGLYDMQGNLWEWCQGASQVHGRDWHVARGGGFNSIPESCRPARAAWFPTEHETWNIGFRIVVPAQ